MLEAIQRGAFGYFLHETNRANGLVRDKTRADWPASIAAVGLALTAYPVGVERGFVPRAEAAERTLTTLRFFWRSKQGPEPDATGYKGFYYHFLDMQTGARAWQCELSTVDSALLLGGMLTAAAYFDGDAPDEREIRDLADRLYARVDWRWAQNGGATVTHGWRPEGGFLPYRWEGYDEALLLYVLGLGSPTHPLSAESYRAWASTYQWKTVYDTQFLYAGPLFTHQLSHVWIDFRGIQDAFMREHGIDYFENSRRATLVQQQYGIRNPRGYAGYGEFCWGITASDGPGEITREVDGVERRFFDYLARGVPDGPDDGTIAPWAVVASLPFAPEIVLPTIAHFDRLHLCGRPSVRLQGDVQSDLPRWQRCPARLGVAVALRHQPGADRRDDREPPIGTGVAIDTRMSAHRRGTAGRRIHRRVALSRGSRREIPGEVTKPRRRGRCATWRRRTPAISRPRTARRHGTQLLSNGRYTVMITAAGSGFSRWRDLAITRWREDATATTAVRTSFSVTSRAASAGRRVSNRAGKRRRARATTSPSPRAARSSSGDRASLCIPARRRLGRPVALRHTQAVRRA